jgi:hypothetical protein
MLRPNEFRVCREKGKIINVRDVDGISFGYAFGPWLPYITGG